MFQKFGLFASFVAAATVAMIPVAPARADVAPPAAIEEVAPATAAAELSAKLERAGMPAAEARAFIDGLTPDELAFVAERTDRAEVGGFVGAAMMAGYWVAFGVWYGGMAIIAAVRSVVADEELAPTEAPAAEPAPAVPALGAPPIAPAPANPETPAPATPATPALEAAAKAAKSAS